MFPAIGINVHNVYATQYRWWRRYVRLAQAQIAAREEQQRAAKAAAASSRRR
jgi:hypothetical protein